MKKNHKQVSTQSENIHLIFLWHSVFSTLLTCGKSHVKLDESHKLLWVVIYG